MGCNSCSSLRKTKSVCKKIIWYSYLGNNHDWFEVSVDNAKKMLALNTMGDPQLLIEHFTNKKESIQKQ